MTKKLNIEELAREAGFHHETSDGWPIIMHDRLEDFVRLIVERCAQEAEELQDTGNHIGECPESAWEQGTLDSAEAIRKLLED